MDKVVTSLPLSPRRNASLGYYSIPFLVDIIASLTGAQAAYPMNILGAKENNLQDVNLHFDMLGRLAISSRLRWLDADEYWDEILYNLFIFGSRQGWVFQDERSVMICPCGKVEFLANNNTLSQIHGARKIYEIRSGKVFCLLCNGIAASKKIVCLLIRFPVYIPPVVIIPRYAAAEWNQLAKDMVNREHLVSRVRETGIRAEFMGMRFNIDVDFTWKLFLNCFFKKGFSCSCIVTGHKTIKHALSAMLINSLAGTPTPDFIVSTPYLSIDFGEQSRKSAEELINGHDAIALRWLLGMMLGHNSKELALQSKLIHLIKHSVGITLKTKEDHSEVIPLDVLWREFNIQRIQKMLAFMRRGQVTDLISIELKLASILGLFSRIS